MAPHLTDVIKGCRSHTADCVVGKGAQCTKQIEMHFSSIYAYKQLAAPGLIPEGSARNRQPRNICWVVEGGSRKGLSAFIPVSAARGQKLATPDSNVLLQLIFSCHIMRVISNAFVQSVCPSTRHSRCRLRNCCLAPCH